MANEDIYPVVGIPVSTHDPTKLPTRQEITTLFQKASEKDRVSQIQVSLLLRALHAIQVLPVTEKLSYFQLAGIHSAPGTPWDGSTPDKQFCPHNRLTFPTWHRPYLTLFEQVLYAKMIEIIDGLFKDKPDPERESEWKQAAYTWRFPYWDWAVKQPYIQNYGVPQVFTTEQFSIIKPDDTFESFQSPFWRYVNPTRDVKTGAPAAFGDKDSMGMYAWPDLGDKHPAWHKTSGTSRYGLKETASGSWVGLEGVNNWPDVNIAIKDPAWYPTDAYVGSLGEAVGRMFSNEYLESYTEFASTHYNKPSKDNPQPNLNFINLEYIHNNVHDITGGTIWKGLLTKADAEANATIPLGAGHMMEIAVSAFDPIFWFHHCNIDRLLAIWQAMNQSWFDKPGDPDEQIDTKLYPFHADLAGNFWTSAMLQNYYALGYEYADIVPNPSSLNPDGSVNKQKYKIQISSLVNELYPGTSHTVQKLSAQNLTGIKLGPQNGLFYDYVINVLYDRYALDGANYSINFYLTKTPLNQDEVSPVLGDFCGKVFTFSNSPARCQNCAEDQKKGNLSKAQVILTSYMLKRLANDRERAAASSGDGAGQTVATSSFLRSMQPEDVESYFKHHLTWEFVAYGGVIQDKSRFPKTKIFVRGGTGEMPSNYNAPGGLPTFTSYKTLYDATGDKPGGGVGRDDHRFGEVTPSA